MRKKLKTICLPNLRNHLILTASQNSPMKSSLCLKEINLLKTFGRSLNSQIDLEFENQRKHPEQHLFF